ncbi:hypothetical protein CC80DRAFT_427898, partial [Byssothecium circinans]
HLPIFPSSHLPIFPSSHLPIFPSSGPHRVDRNVSKYPDSCSASHVELNKPEQDFW